MGKWALFFVVVFGVVLFCLMAVLRKLRGERILRERMQAVSRVAQPGAMATLNEKDIRARVSNTSPLIVRLGRFIGYDPRLARDSKLPWPVTVIICIAFGTFAGWRGRAMLGDVPGVLIGALTALFAMRGSFAKQRSRYAQALFKQLPDAIGLMIRAVQAGVPLSEALKSVAREMPEPTRGEFSRIVGAVSIGRPVDQAIWGLYHRTKLTEYSYLAVTLGLQAQTGGSLAETLTNLSEMVRKRVQMASRARALASESKTSATVMIALPFISGTALSFMQPGYIGLFMNTRMGNNLLITGLALIGLGAMTMRWLTMRAMRD